MSGDSKVATGIVGEGRRQGMRAGRLSRVHRSLRLLAVGLAALWLVGCEAIDCTPSFSEAFDGAVLDLADITASSVLEARLTSADEALAGRQIEFSLQQQDQFRYLGSSETAADGIARFDLKQLDTTLVQVLQEAALREGSFRAEFRGDGTYCRSESRARIHVVGLS